MVVEVIKSQSYKYNAPRNKEILEIYQLNNLEKIKEIILSLKEQKKVIIKKNIRQQNLFRH